MENELLKAWMGNPIFGGGSVVAALVGLFYYARKMYLSMQQDSAATETMTTNLAATRQVVEMLNSQVEKLTQQVNELRDIVAKLTDERRNLIEDNLKLQRELDECKEKSDVPV